MRIAPCVMVMASLSISSGARAIGIGSMDDFQNGTVSEWFGGTTITPQTNGQMGASDWYVTIASTGGSGAGSKLAAHNSEPRWTGDYLAAGVTAVGVDMRNEGSTTLQMRVVMFGLGNRFTSTTAFTLAPNSGWQHLTFPVTQAALTRVLGSGTYADTLGSVSQIMFRHDGSTPSSGGEAIIGKVGIDNVVAIPAPGAAGIIGLAGIFAARRRRV